MRTITALCTILVLTQAAVAQIPGLIDFFPRVDSACNHPEWEKKLKIVCRKKLSGRYVTFVGYEGDSRVLLAAVTLKPFKDAQDSISRDVEFGPGGPNAGKITTWGYVYDRNGDGKIDYMAIVGGAAAFKPRDFPESFPERVKPLTESQADYFVGHCKIVFNHWADDNFDGTLDAAVQIDMDPKRDWVDRRIVVRSTHFDGAYDDVWSFTGSMESERDSVEHTAESVPYLPIGKPQDRIGRALFTDRTNILMLMNRAAKECGLTASNFYLAPQSE